MATISFSAKPINKDLGLLLFRLIIGLMMAFHGLEKFLHFNEMAGSDFWANVNFLGMTGETPLSLAIFAELFCSIFLIFGFLTRLSLLVLGFCMAYIFLIVMPGSLITKGPNGYAFNDAFFYFVIYFGLYFTGPGRYSLDKMFFKKDD